MNIFVGNLLFDATGGDVKKLFEGYGFVASVVIVMRKEKKAPKSRGFGFVQMPDEQQALAAIAALNGKEFMGRVLNVNPARPNPTGIALPIQQDGLSYPNRKGPSPINPTRVGHPIHFKDGPKEGAKTEARRESEKNKISNGVKEKRQPGRYKGGRRTHSYMKRRGLAGMQKEAKPWRKNQDNPMRWRKREDQPRPWQKSSGEHKPWKKAEEGSRPWKKAEGESKPWRKSEGGFKPWKKTEGESRPWKRSESGFKPWKKPAGDAKPWSKSSERPSTTLRTALSERSESNGRSRTKGRKKPGGYKR